MTKRMLIDGTHPEEIRVVITSGNRLEEYDVETSTKTQLKGNIYLAKVTRVEPSLQAAFVDYGGNRHGFLAFNEIHPDYYQIPVEDREALKRDVAQFEANASAAQAHIDEIDGDVEETTGDQAGKENIQNGEFSIAAEEILSEKVSSEINGGSTEQASAKEDDGHEQNTGLNTNEDIKIEEDGQKLNEKGDSGDETEDNTLETAKVEGGKAEKDNEKIKKSERRENPMRRYKIQEVIKRRQILLIQVVKEERGNKGAALTTYLSLAGRYCVLMPNTARNGGGVSRKITSTADRRRLRDLLKNLNVLEGMGVIMRTAGMERNKSEIKRDFDYLTRLWENVRELTLQSAAPALVYEEGDLIKRAIRDLYNREIEEIFVEGNNAYTAAKKLMRMMMPSHAKRVQPYRDEVIPLYHRYQVETQLEAMHSPDVQLKSGGYIVINPTEALVAIDVNSGRSTRERNIEETAFKTNLEAASEVARQLRLRDLSGLIVIDFIDMEVSRNQRAVERRLKESVKTDRARIQLGRISNFGLFELSRQRMRPSIVENSTETCIHCAGTGYVRSTESTAIHVLRSVEEEGIRSRSKEVAVTVPTPIALYILNQKRESLTQIEMRYNFRVHVFGDDSLIPPDMRLERIQGRPATAETEDVSREANIIDPSNDSAASDNDDVEKEATKSRRPRRRRKNASVKKNDDKKSDGERETEQSLITKADKKVESEEKPTEDRAPRRRRRGRRGGRRRNNVGANSAGIKDKELNEQRHDSGGLETESDTSDKDKNSAAESSKEEILMSGRDNQSLAAGNAKEKATLKDSENTPSSTSPETKVKSEEKPKRGWWQKITK